MEDAYLSLHLIFAEEGRLSYGLIFQDGSRKSQNREEVRGIGWSSLGLGHLWYVFYT